MWELYIKDFSLIFADDVQILALKVAAHECSHAGDLSIEFTFEECRELSNFEALFRIIDSGSAFDIACADYEDRGLEILAQPKAVALAGVNKKAKTAHFTYCPHNERFVQLLSTIRMYGSWVGEKHIYVRLDLHGAFRGEGVDRPKPTKAQFLDGLVASLIVEPSVHFSNTPMPEDVGWFNE